MRKARPAAALLIVVLAGCDSPANRQRMALDGVSRLREAFHQRDCQSIYDEAEAFFRKSQPADKWRSQCEHLISALGPWLAFRDISYFPLSADKGAMIVAGRAVFTTGECHMDTYWRLDGGRARFYLLTLKRGSMEIAVPPFKPLPELQPMYMDPPPPVPRG